MTNLNIDALITVDDTGMPQAPNLRQLLDKDVRQLYTRDVTPDKKNYIADCIVIYMVGDPKSPARQQGLTEDECYKFAIEQSGVKKDYKSDLLVRRLIKKYNDQNITEAGKVVDNLLKAIHNENKIIDKYLTFLGAEIDCAATIEGAIQVDNIMQNINKIAKSLPDLITSLNTAKQNLALEIQEEQSRGGGKVLSSMNAEDYM